jgi:hypothetical protein
MEHRAHRRLQLVSAHVVAATDSRESTGLLRRNPPPPVTDAAAAVSATLRAGLSERCLALRTRMAAVDHALLADVGAFVKAVEFAVRFDEWYTNQDGSVASGLLDEAATRLKALEAGATDDVAEPTADGLVVRGYTSAIDGSDQPYGLEIPASPPPAAGWPLYIWLHGSASTTTDLRFIHGCQTAKQGGDSRPTPSGALVLHPFGRHCNGYKWAGELDVLDSITHIQTLYPVDPVSS